MRRPLEYFFDRLIAPDSTDFVKRLPSRVASAMLVGLPITFLLAGAVILHTYYPALSGRKRLAAQVVIALAPAMLIVVVSYWAGLGTAAAKWRRIADVEEVRRRLVALERARDSRVRLEQAQSLHARILQVRREFSDATFCDAELDALMQMIARTAAPPESRQADS